MMRPSIRVLVTLAVCTQFFIFGQTVEIETGKSQNATQPPNIIFILADDLGFNDVSFHGSTQIPTPNLDKLAYSGILLSNYYVQSICTPTRSALMTGRYPIHTGMWHSVIIAPQPYGLGLHEVLLPQLLKKQGYDTHMVGKWHLGFFEKKYTPTFRGFDSHFGYYNGKGDYWTHYDNETYGGFDFHANGSIYKPVYGQYSTSLFTQEAQKIIGRHDPAKPLFLYLAHQAVHSANEAKHYLQAPQRYYDRFPNITNDKRRMFAAMVSALDDNVGDLIDSLKMTGLYDNSIIIFSTDNGGPAAGFDHNYANNYPLRGLKAYLWEGGVRGAGFVHSPLLEKPGRISHEMMHVTDWLPTIYGLAGGNVSKLTNLDGYDMWPMLSLGAPSPRTEMLLNIDTILGKFALRMGHMKIIVESKVWSDWYAPEGLPTDYNPPPPPTTADVVQCLIKPSNASTNCEPRNGTCLYNITNDPCEFYNIADWNQDIVANMTDRLNYYYSTMVPSSNRNEDSASNPQLHGGFWVPWFFDEEDARPASGNISHGNVNTIRTV